MSSSSHIETILRKAKEQEKKYNWLGAAKSFEQALNLESRTVSFVAETWERIGFCYSRASVQAEDLEGFKKMRQLSVEAYKRAAQFFEKEDSLKNQGKSAQCNAIAEYVRSWLASSPSEKRKMLDECRLLGNKSLEAYEIAGDELSYGKMSNDLLLCLLERLYVASDWREIRNIAQEGIDCANKAIAVLSKLGNKSELLRTYFTVSLQCWYAYIDAEEDRRKQLMQISLSYSEKAVKLSREVDNLHYCAMSNWAAAFCALLFTEKVESAAEYAKEMLRQGTILRDNYLKGVASYILAFATNWMILSEEDPDKRKERHEKIIKHSKNAIRYLQLVSQDFFIAETYLFYAETYSSLARDAVTSLEEKRAICEKAVEIGRKGLEHATRSDSPDAMISTLHALSKALHFYSKLETGNDEKTKILEEALIHRKEYTNIVERSSPFNDWIRGVGKHYEGLIKADLAKIETDRDKKRPILESAVSDMEDSVLHCRRWVLSRPVPTQIVITAGFEDSFGEILNELYLLTQDKEILNRAIEVYNDAAKRFKKVNLASRAAESYWKIARNQDHLGKHKKATENFRNAFTQYKAAAQKSLHFVDFYLDYATYMKAWSEIERAKLAHNKREYATAMKRYRKTATLLKQTKVWNYLSSNFLAWSLLEQAEDLSRKERSLHSIKAFNRAAELFRESKSSLRGASGKIENEDEKYLVKRLTEVSDTRGEYCSGRVTIEEAKILDRQGEHVAGSEKYGSAAKVFQSIAETESEQIRRELQPIIYLCRAWQKMLMAEAMTSSSMYGEAAELFQEAKTHALDQSTSLLALAHSSFCKALEAGAEFEITRNTKMYSAAKKHMGVAANCYLKSGFETAAEYANGTQRLLDAYAFIETAKMETDQEKKAKYYTMAEKVLQFSAESFMKAKHPEKIGQVQQLLEKIKEERELAVMLNEILIAPTIVSSTASFAIPTPTEERAVGLESFERANIQATLVSQINHVRAGEDFNLEMHVVNVGREAILLAEVNEILPEGFELVAKPDYCHLENSHVNLKGKRLDPLKTEEIRLVLRSFTKGSYVVKPKIAYRDEIGRQMFCEPDSLAIDVSEITLPSRVATGYPDLDKLLFGGIPENYPVILTSPFCDERGLLIKKFLQEGLKKDEIIFHVTIDPSQVRDLLEKYQSNFFGFVCNPHVKKIIPDLPNVFKLEGVENLTQISITLTKAFRGLGEPRVSSARACIEIVSDILIKHQAVQTRRWLTELVTELKARGFTTLAVMNPLMHPSQDVQAILGLFEGEISIYDKKTRKGLQKCLKINRMYNQKYLKSELFLRKERLGVAIDVSEVAVSSRVATGYPDLDKLLFGGIPENYPVILTSPFCDERDLLIKRFLQEGTKKGQIAFYVTIDASGAGILAEEFQSNFYLFVCNPRADMIIKDLPNIFKLSGVMNLTNINIALTNAFGRLDESSGDQRRICIDIISDVLFQHKAVTTKRWLTELVTELKARGFTTLAVMNPLMHPSQDVQAILGLFEGEISIYDKKTRKGLQKCLKINRMYNQKYLENELLLRKEKLEK